jgi:hypothetical protein
VSTAASHASDTDPLTLAIQYSFAMSAIGAVAFIPAAVVIAAAEVFRLRSVFYFLAVGGLLGIVLNEANSSDALSLALLDRENLVFPAAGFAAGFVYWLVAGRLSGRFGGALPAVRENQPDGKGAEHPGE